VNLALSAVPTGIDRDGVERYLTSLPSVTSVHDLHIWGMSTTETALTAHLTFTLAPSTDDLLRDAAHELEHRFRIHHATLQLETGDAAQGCRLAPDEVV